jgi:hypothetical protein
LKRFYTHIAFATLAVVASAPAFAGDEGTSDAAQVNSVSWSILGPAWSKHMGTEAAVMHDEGSPTKVAGSDCSNYATEGVLDSIPPSGATLKAAGLPTARCAVSSIKNTRAVSVIWNCDPAVNVAQPGTGAHSYSTPVAKCSLSVAHRKPVWHQMNPAFGLSRTVQQGSTSDTLFVGFARDSYGSPTIMAGATHAWRVLQVGTVQADAGITAGVWWRTEMRYVDTSQAYYDGKSNWSYEQRLVRRFVPVVLPMMAFKETTTGLGLNVMYAPKLKVGGYSVNDTSTWMFQTTLVVSTSHRGETKVGIEPQPGGALASLAATF